MVLKPRTCVLGFFGQESVALGIGFQAQSSCHHFSVSQFFIPQKLSVDVNFLKY